MLAVMLFQHGFVHTVQLLAGQDGEQAPAKVQALVDGAVLIGALAQKFLFEVGAEIQIQFIGLASSSSPMTLARSRASFTLA